MRIQIVRIIIVFAFLLIVGGLFYVQVIQGHYYYTLSTNNRIRVVSMDGRRGQIFDRNGVILADNRVSFDVMLIPQEVEGTERILDYLSRVLEVEKNKLVKTYTQKKLAPFT